VELYLHCPNKPSWRGAQLKKRKHRDFILISSLSQERDVLQVYIFLIPEICPVSEIFSITTSPPPTIQIISDVTGCRTISLNQFYYTYCSKGSSYNVSTSISLSLSSSVIRERKMEDVQACSLLLLLADIV
jgi:hypothetical protein